VTGYVPRCFTRNKLATSPSTGKLQGNVSWLLDITQVQEKIAIKSVYVLLLSYVINYVVVLVTVVAM